MEFVLLEPESEPGILITDDYNPVEHLSADAFLEIRKRNLAAGSDLLL